MADALRLSFQLTAQADARSDDARLEVRVSGPGGEARGETGLPPASLLDEIAQHDPARLPSSVVDKVGQALYAALVAEAVDELVVDTLNDGIRDQRVVQFELRFDPDQVGLTRYPWEMVQNAQGQFLVRDGLIDLTRYITYPQPPPAFDVSVAQFPLLRVIATPEGLPPIATPDLTIAPVVTLNDATFEDLLRRMLIERLALWGLQFDGHGALVAQCPKCDTLNSPGAAACRQCRASLEGAKRVGALAFERGAEINWVPASELGSVLYNAQVRLALLNACETAVTGSRLVFSGLAAGLLLAGVPAVIGMQYPVLDRFANSFANEFYAALRRDNDLLAALRVARRMNMQDAWYAPALYLRRKPTAQEEQARPAVTYQARAIDTAAPARVVVATTFLTRLWIRRLETQPLGEEQLRAELDIPTGVPVRTGTGEAEIKFEPVPGRMLRRGEVEARLQAPGCDVVPDSIRLFVDEHLDAPPAIFTVTPRQTGRIPLIFSVWQDGGQVHSVVHHIEVVSEEQAAAAGIVPGETGPVAHHSQTVPVSQPDATRGGVFPSELETPDDRTGAVPPPRMEERPPAPPPPTTDYGGSAPPRPAPPATGIPAPAPSRPASPPASVPMPSPGAPRPAPPPTDIPAPAPSRPAPPVARQRKGGVPVLRLVALMAGVLVCGALFFSGLVVALKTFNQEDTPTPTLEPTATPTPTPAEEVTGPPPPDLLAPKPQETLTTCDPVTLFWSEPRHPVEIGEYVVEMEMQDQSGVWQPLARQDGLQRTLAVFEVRCLRAAVTSYRWRVQAIDRAGRAGQFSEWGYFQIAL